MKLEWLDLNPDVRLTPTLENGLPMLDPFFDNLPTLITSGYRSSRDQVEVILQLAKSNGLYGNFTELREFKDSDPAVKFPFDSKEQIYWWQRAWSKLLENGVIVNPPLMATCLYDYIRSSGENMKGKVLQPSNHSQGNAVDLSAKEQMDEKVQRLESAKRSGVIKSYMVERKQNCLHVNFNA